MNGKVECGQGVTRNAQLANRKLITIVLYESGGVEPRLEFPQKTFIPRVFHRLKGAHLHIIQII